MLVWIRCGCSSINCMKRFCTESPGKMKVGNCKHGLCFLLIMFPLRRWLSLVWTANQTSHRCNTPAYCNLVTQGNDLSLMWIPPSRPPLPGYQSAGNCRSRESQSFRRADLLVTICEAFDSLLFACYGCDA